MRLIDADAFLERMLNSIYDSSDLKEMLDSEPTAFDVDNVVEILKEKAMAEGISDNRVSLGMFHAYNNAS